METREGAAYQCYRETKDIVIITGFEVIRMKWTGILQRDKRISRMTTESGLITFSQCSSLSLVYVSAISSFSSCFYESQD